MVSHEVVGSFTYHRVAKTMAKLTNWEFTTSCLNVREIKIASYIEQFKDHLSTHSDRYLTRLKNKPQQTQLPKELLEPISA